MSEHTEEVPKDRVGGFFPEGYTPPQNGYDYWDEDEGPDPYENVAAWVNYRREQAQHQYGEDLDHSRYEYQDSTWTPEPWDYWYGPGFASVFAEKIGGPLDSFTTMPTIPAVIDYLEEEYSKKLERPDCDYLSNILHETFPQPNARVTAALQWLEQRKVELRCWPPERVGGHFVGRRKPGPYNQDIDSDAKQVDAGIELPAMPDTKQGIAGKDDMPYTSFRTKRQIALYHHYINVPIINYDKASELAAKIGLHSKSSGTQLINDFKEVHRSSGITGKDEIRAIRSMIADIEAVSAFLTGSALDKALANQGTLSKILETLSKK